jgi:hypothetical protein
MSPRARALYLLWALASGSCSSGASSGITNWSFDVWCDGIPCGWNKDMGSVLPVATWHKKDLGVSFETQGTQLSQAISPSIQRCLLFDVIAEVDPAAQLTLQLDFNEDGVIDLDYQIVAAHWRSVAPLFPVPRDYFGVRISVLKKGVGKAVLAQLRIEPTDECQSEPNLLKLGSACAFGAACESGVCIEARCAPHLPASVDK